MKIYFALLFAFIFGSSNSNVLANELSAGLKFQQALHFYNENGITLEYSSDDILDNAITFGASYYTSRIGTAFHSNAIPQDNFLVHSTYYFLHDKPFKPMVKLNAGYCFADYGSELFHEIDNSMPLLSFELGAAYAFDVPLKLHASIGYNLHTSDGISGVGTVYPLFAQYSVLWRFAL